MDERDTQRDNDNDMDFQEHEKTYKLFVSAALWGTLTVAVILILMAIFLL
ncbi:MAG: aa3-type cytochrome c oxidase subunit IV [Dichotomicrobium sp.]